jgi:MarR family transcriptional regulator, organic hydroperoxide resistance regulator
MSRTFYRDIYFCDIICGMNDFIGIPMKDSTPRPLDQQLCFTLYAASMAVTRMYKPMLDRMGITYPQYLVLAALGERDGLSVGAIADRLALESSTVTPPLKRMEHAGLVERRRSKEDERQVNVFMTTDGRKLLEESRCLGDTLVERSKMTAEDVQGLNVRMKKFLAAVNEEG